MNEEKLRKRIWNVISTETLYRKWERRLIVALTEAERQKCLNKLRLYKGVT